MATLATARKQQSLHGSFHRTLLTFLGTVGNSWQGTVAELETNLVTGADRSSLPTCTGMVKILGNSITTLSHQGWQVTFGRCKNGRWINFRRIGR